MADANKRTEKGITKAIGLTGADAAPEPPKPSPTAATRQAVTEEQFEVLPDISIEEVSESNRTITRVVVRKNQKETVFSKVVYTWGGVYYFKQNVSISETLFFMNTGRR